MLTTKKKLTEILAEILPENFPTLGKAIKRFKKLYKPQVESLTHTHSHTHTHTPRHTPVDQVLKRKTKKNPKCSQRGKEDILPSSSQFSIEIIESRIKWNDIIKVLTESNSQNILRRKYTLKIK